MRLTRMLVLAVSLLLGVGLALAQGDVKVTGTGTLTAKGGGTARVVVIKGSVVISGQGQLTIIGTPKVTFTGTPGAKEEKDVRQQHVVMYKSFKGKATINGEKFAVALQSTSVDLTAKGAGMGILVGKGSYTVAKDGARGTTKGDWIGLPSKTEEKKRLEPVQFGEFTMPQHAPQTHRENAPKK